MTTQEPPEESDPNTFICACEKHMRHACDRKGFYKEKEGKRYCVLHYPGEDKESAFRIALNNKLAAKDYNFNGVWFLKGVRFKELHWDRNADFSSATFNEYIDLSGVAFNVKALFNNATFNAGVDFSRAIFPEGAEFSGASFRKGADFGKASFIKDADFSRTSFDGDADFSEARFIRDAHFGSADFSSAVFSIASFDGDADFSEAHFSKDTHFVSARFSKDAHFSRALFSMDARFPGTRFNADAFFGEASFSADADFNYASFNADAFFGEASFSADADFSFASFSEVVEFSEAIFCADTSFKRATFKDYVYFGGELKRRAFGDQTQLNFQSTTFEKPDRVSFHTLNLKPHWFIEVDSRKFVFTDVGFNFDLKEELERLKKAEVGAPHRLLSIACRQLALNAEENHRYGQAAGLRYASMDAERMEWLQDRKIKRFHLLHWLYWIVSGYGERVRHAFWTLVVLWLLFAFFYTKVGFEHKTIKPGNDQQSVAAQEDVVGKPLPFKKIFTYSLGVMSLQKPDPKPVTIAAQTLVIFESILCPLQAALLALAIRRRFMR